MKRIAIVCALLVMFLGKQALPQTAEWDAKAKDLAGRFIKNFVKYEGNAAGKALVPAGPQLPAEKPAAPKAEAPKAEAPKTAPEAPKAEPAKKVCWLKRLFGCK